MAERGELRLCGYGGQGIILAGYIVGQAAAVFEHKQATFIPDYGPEARGGACRADLVISDEPVTYPYVSAPSVLVAMSQQGYDKYHLHNRDDTLLVVDEDLVKPLPASQRLLSIPARRIAEGLGRVAVANVVMLGFLTAVTSLITMESMKESLLAAVPKGTEKLNMKAFEQGYRYGLKNVGATGKGKALA
jgi:2-oxoglutarate ferredoxin oxidoreductase subunit gamma